MKKRILILGLSLFFTVSFAQEKKSIKATEQPVKAITANTSTSSGSNVKASSAEITFAKDIHDFGTINKGDNGTFEFNFKNSGKEPLIISNAQGSCGCTVPQWPKEPIAPGGTGVIKVTYDTKRIGAFTKTVTITSNAQTSSKVLTIKGMVNDIPAEETFPAKKLGTGSPLENSK
ncbi:MAG: DUF1573 domain-containing protein [Bacteroidia bacterium]|nr:DUF1573 domain-containing protein [Bacteroidia bacterium]MCZ2248910.1 DUF1573 domain-containing protein [Bacteroidia bacterium]